MSERLVQQRSNIRTNAPEGHDFQDAQRLAQALVEQQQERVATIVMFTPREAILTDLPRLDQEVKHLGRINVQNGTKGGRLGASAPR